MRKRIKIKAKRIAAGALAFMMAAGSIPAARIAKPLQKRKKIIIWITDTCG